MFVQNNSIITIEKERDSSMIDVVRIYFNWRLSSDESGIIKIFSLIHNW
jgi:hypothetical protein